MGLQLPCNFQRIILMQRLIISSVKRCRYKGTQDGCVSSLATPLLWGLLGSEGPKLALEVKVRSVFLYLKMSSTGRCDRTLLEGEGPSSRNKPCEESKACNPHTVNMPLSSEYL